MALINTGKIAEPVATGDHFFSATAKADFVVCKGPQKLKLLLDELQPGKVTFYLSDGDWSMHDLVMELVKRFQPAELFITTYALREFSVRQLILAIDRKEISAVSMLLDYRAPIRTPAVHTMAAMNFKIFLLSVHAKVTVIRSPVGCVTITGSANWTTNPKLESGVISLDPDLAAWYIENIKNVMANAKIFE
jgi:hypothetical protein